MPRTIVRLHESFIARLIASPASLLSFNWEGRWVVLGAEALHLSFTQAGQALESVSDLLMHVVQACESARSFAAPSESHSFPFSFIADSMAERPRRSRSPPRAEGASRPPQSAAPPPRASSARVELSVDALSLLCSVCLQDLLQCRGNIRQCRFGHLICSTCLSRVPSDSLGKVPCPTCRHAVPREDFGFSPILEEAMQSRHVACPLGCSKMLAGKDAALSHLETCPAQLAKCPVCPRRLKLCDLRVHCHQEHIAGTWKSAVSRPGFKFCWKTPIGLVGGQFGVMLRFVCIHFEKNLARITLEMPPVLNPTQTTPLTVRVTCFELLDGRTEKASILQRQLLPDGSRSVLAFDVGDPSMFREIRFSVQEPVEGGSL